MDAQCVCVFILDRIDWLKWLEWTTRERKKFFFFLFFGLPDLKIARQTPHIHTHIEKEKECVRRRGRRRENEIAIEKKTERIYTHSPYTCTATIILYHLHFSHCHLPRFSLPPFEITMCVCVGKFFFFTFFHRV